CPGTCSASRHLRHKQHGVIADDGSAVLPVQRFEDTVYQKVASVPDGMAVGEITAAFPGTSTATLYRAFDKLVKTNRLVRTGKPRTPEVRYCAVWKCN